MITITIPGKPIAKKRPRFARKGKFVKTYNEQETEESRFLWEVKSQITECISDEPISIDCHFYMPRPKNHYGTGRNAGKLKKDAPIFHIKKPDLDNLVKFVLDCLNGVAWKDDSQIYNLTATKIYTKEPKTVIEIFD